MLDNFIDKRLDKQGFMKVPKSWSKDYVELVEKHRTLNKVLRVLGEEYNEVLRELAECKGVKWIKDALKEIGVEMKKGINNEELIELYLDTFKVDFEEDTDEEIVK